MHVVVPTILSGQGRETDTIREKMCRCFTEDIAKFNYVTLSSRKSSMLGNVEVQPYKAGKFNAVSGK